MITFSLQPVSKCLFIENGLKEIFGSELVNEKAGLNGQLPVLNSLKKSLTRKIGEAEVGGMYLRAGRAGFYYWMREFSTLLGWKAVEFRLLPPNARIRRALTDLLRWMEDENILHSELTETSAAWRISINGLTGKDAHLDCNYFTGMVQELSCWAGGGKFYPTSESQCQAAGDACCVFVIDKQPVG